MVYDRGDSFWAKGNLHLVQKPSSQSYPIHCERKWEYSFLSVSSVFTFDGYPALSVSRDVQCSYISSTANCENTANVGTLHVKSEDTAVSSVLMGIQHYQCLGVVRCLHWSPGRLLIVAIRSNWHSLFMWRTGFLLLAELCGTYFRSEAEFRSVQKRWECCEHSHTSVQFGERRKCFTPCIRLLIIGTRSISTLHVERWVHVSCLVVCNMLLFMISILILCQAWFRSIQKRWEFDEYNHISLQFSERRKYLSLYVSHMSSQHLYFKQYLKLNQFQEFSKYEFVCIYIGNH